MLNHNHLAVWAMVIAHQAAGFIWYSPFLFANPWVAGQGKTLEQMNSADPEPFVYSILASILACYFISWFVQAANSTTIKDGLIIGAFLSLGMVFPALAVHYKFLGISDNVLWIDLGMSALTTIMTVVVLSVWRRPGSSERY